jgi:hypothetical protein
VALTPAGALVAGQAAGSALLTVAGGTDVNLGAVAPERTVDAVAGAPGGELVAAGSTNGSPAVWSSPNGTAWTRASLPGGAQGRLTGLVHGSAGWLAAGQSGTRSLVFSSPDGTSWQAAKISGTATAVAAGPGGYVIVGGGPAGAAAWYSADLKTWKAAAGAGKTDLTGAKTQMSAVVAGSAGYVAVGRRGTAPAVWTSPDGRTWILHGAPASTGALTGLVANGTVLVASGLVASGSAPASGLVVRSTDGGTTWQPVSLPGFTAGNAVTATTVASGRVVRRRCDLAGVPAARHRSRRARCAGADRSHLGREPAARGRLHGGLPGGPVHAVVDLGARHPIAMCCGRPSGWAATTGSDCKVNVCKVNGRAGSRRAGRGTRGRSPAAR